MSEINKVKRWMEIAGQFDGQDTADSLIAFQIGILLEETAEVLTSMPITQDTKATIQAMQLLGQRFKSRDAAMMNLLQNADRANLLQETLDVLWVAAGGAAAQSKDPTAAFDALADSNYSKFPKTDSGGYLPPERDPATGKVKKPATYRKPDFAPFVNQGRANQQ